MSVEGYCLSWSCRSTADRYVCLVIALDWIPRQRTAGERTPGGMMRRPAFAAQFSQLNY